MSSSNGNIEMTTSDDVLNYSLEGGDDQADNKEDSSFLLNGKHQRAVAGVMCSLALAALWIGFAQISQDIQSDSFGAILLIVYFYTIWIIFFYPIYFLIIYARSRGKLILKEEIREDINIFSYQPVKRLPFIGKTAVFYLLWVTSLYSFVKGLSSLSATDIMALYATNHSFVYMLSWIILFEKFIALRILAMIFSITGIVLFAYVDGFVSPSMRGVVMGVASSSAISVIKMLLKKIVIGATVGQFSILISLIGLFSLVCTIPFIILLHFTTVEVINWSAIPWQHVGASTVLLLAHQVITNYAPFCTDQVYVGVGLFIGIPFCSLADIQWKGKHFAGMKIAAIVLICLGLFLILLPENWHRVFTKCCCCKKEPQEVQITETPRNRLRMTMSET